jgi:hypothetical protein
MKVQPIGEKFDALTELYLRVLLAELKRTKSVQNFRDSSSQPSI